VRVGAKDVVGNGVGTGKRVFFVFDVLADLVPDLFVPFGFPLEVLLVLYDLLSFLYVLLAWYVLLVLYDLLVWYVLEYGFFFRL